MCKLQPLLRRRILEGARAGPQRKARLAGSSCDVQAHWGASADSRLLSTLLALHTPITLHNKATEVEATMVIIRRGYGSGSGGGSGSDRDTKRTKTKSKSSRKPTIVAVFIECRVFRRCSRSLQTVCTSTVVCTSSAGKGMLWIKCATEVEDEATDQVWDRNRRRSHGSSERPKSKTKLRIKCATKFEVRQSTALVEPKCDTSRDYHQVRHQWRLLSPHHMQ